MRYTIDEHGWTVELITGRDFAARPGPTRFRPGPARPGPARPEKYLNFQARNGPKKNKNKRNIFIAESYMKKPQENQRIFSKLLGK